MGLEKTPSRAPGPESLFKGLSEMAKTTNRRASHNHCVLAGCQELSCKRRWVNGDVCRLQRKGLGHP